MNKPKRAGSAYERLVADYCADQGLPWDRAPLRGTRDLLDLQGPQQAGFLVGCKAITRGTAFGQRISEAMDQCDQALMNYGRPATRGRGFVVVDSGGIVPVQVMQRSGYPAGKHYVVTQLDYFLALAKERVIIADEAARQKASRTGQQRHSGAQDPAFQISPPAHN